ncbi:glutaredoxin family protein [Candidatus Saccharibacteria bacterium]|nr:glutaredoxin family protein [Candidatus Saccharibacteria bacterium]
MIKVYTTPTCAYCHALMDWLDELGVQYVEKDATKELDINTVPVTEIDGKRIVGFDRPAIKKALKKVNIL